MNICKICACVCCCAGDNKYLIFKAIVNYLNLLEIFKRLNQVNRQMFQIHQHMVVICSMIQIQLIQETFIHHP